MILLSSIIQLFEAELLAQYCDRLLPSHLNALAAMKQCRTSASPKLRAQCRACEHQILIPHSCGHRSCPHCQHHESQQWLESQLQKLVPGQYFLVTFTLPATFRALAFANQSTLFSLLIQCAWQTLSTFAHNDKQLQGTPGAIAVLHTHSRRLDFHPHVHLIIPAAAIDAKNRLWRTKSAKGKRPYLFNHKALAKVFRAKMLDAITIEGLALPNGYAKKWVVDCKCVGSGEKAVVYLGRYLYRGVIREKDILSCENGQVSFCYKEAKSGCTKTRKLSGAKFLWLILQHVLPKGFRRARNFGFFHPNSKRLLALIQYFFGVDPQRLLALIKPRPPITCPCCGAPMKITQTRITPALLGASPVAIGQTGGAA